MSSHEKQKEMSKKWIADSFITLMKTKPYEQITISEIPQAVAIFSQYNAE